MKDNKCTFKKKSMFFQLLRERERERERESNKVLKVDRKYSYSCNSGLSVIALLLFSVLNLAITKFEIYCFFLHHTIMMMTSIIWHPM